MELEWLFSRVDLLVAYKVPVKVLSNALTCIIFYPTVLLKDITIGIVYRPVSAVHSWLAHNVMYLTAIAWLPK